MAETFPASLPAPNAAPRGSSAASVNRTKMDSGRIRQTARFPTILDRWVLAFDFNGEEFATFKTFFEDDLESGVKYFTIALPLGGADGPRPPPMSALLVGPMNTLSFLSTTTASRQRLSVKFVQVTADPVVDPLPVWFRPEIPSVGTIILDPDVHRNALFYANPGTGNTRTLVVPAIAGVGDVLPIGVRLDGAGTIIVKTDGEGDVVGEPGVPPYHVVIESLAPRFHWTFTEISGATVGDLMGVTSGTLREVTQGGPLELRLMMGLELRLPMPSAWLRPFSMTTSLLGWDFLELNGVQSVTPQ